MARSIKNRIRERRANRAAKVEPKHIKPRKPKPATEATEVDDDIEDEVMFSGNERTQRNKIAFLNALERSAGIVVTACKSTGVARPTYYKWLNSDKAFKDKADEVQEIQIDIVESSLLSRIREKDTTATIFYLKTKAKKRGYVERQEFSGPEGSPIPVRVGVSEDSVLSILDRVTK